LDIVVFFKPYLYEIRIRYAGVPEQAGFFRNSPSLEILPCPRSREKGYTGPVVLLPSTGAFKKAI
jgi:hypothetical protein